jgi:uncharacterized protein
MALLEKTLFIKRSKLPRAGKGLFTKKEISKGTRIVEYKGRKRKWKDVKQLDGHNGYLMYITRNAVIDALPATKTLGRYANDAQGLSRIPGLTNNSDYVSEGHRCYIEAKRTIQKGEELLVGYGKEFWQLIDFNTAYKLKVPDMIGDFFHFFYQIRIRASGFLYNLFPGFTPKASYQASIFTGAPMVLNSEGECESVTINCAFVSGKVLLRHTCAHARKNR